MSNVIDYIFNEVCLDSRIPDGIFRMEETEHMDVLREFFIKNGISKNETIEITNKMLEGKYPERQAYRKEDGILVTWPSVKHKQKAMKENPGKYVDENPFPKKDDTSDDKKSFKKDKSDSDDFESSKQSEDDFDDTKNDIPTTNLFDKDVEVSQIKQGDKTLSVEPLAVNTQANTNVNVPTTSSIVQPKTPERIAAEKSIVNQIINLDDTELTDISNPLYEEYKQSIIKELYIEADKLGLKEVVSFLTSYVKI